MNRKHNVKTHGATLKSAKRLTDALADKADDNVQVSPRYGE